MFKALLATQKFHFFVQFTFLVPTTPISKLVAVFKQINIKILIVPSLVYSS
jgi:hypothetical protein